MRDLIESDVQPTVEALYVSYEDYLRIEEAHDTRYEYAGGALYAMVGASKRHNRIISNLVRETLDAADAHGCQIYSSDVKLRVSATTVYYPDLTVVCDADDPDPLVSTRPCLIIEVASPSTRRTDRREKLSAYKEIDGLRAYLIVEQSTRLVIRHWRESDDDPWQTELHTAEAIPIACLNIELSLDAIYRNLPEDGNSDLD